MWNVIIDWLSEPLFYPIWVFGVPFITSLPFIVIDTLQIQLLKPYMLRSSYPSWEDQWREIKKAFTTFTLYMTIAFLLRYFNVKSFIYHHLHNYPHLSLYNLMLELVYQVVVYDFLYYGVHRYLHKNKYLYRTIHQRHHLFIEVWSLTGKINNRKAELLNVLLILIPYFVTNCQHVFSLYLFITFSLVFDTIAHTGYDFPISEYPRSHYIHHARVRCNYAGFTTIPDRLFGTYVREISK